MIDRKKLAHAVRFLSTDAIEKAQSGHPGAPMGMADMAEALWRHHLKHNPANPHWVNRDRFVLSNGHASMMLYALLHLTGYDVSMDDIRDFRTLNSKTPGHPEFGKTPGIETTTGPLGQGIATAVGMALAERHLASRFNKEALHIVDHNTYVFLGDGCMMEGVSYEACSLAGTLGLHKLVALYDANDISIDGNIAAWFDEDVVARFLACGWNVVGPIDGHDAAALDSALEKAHAYTQQSSGKPTLIICKTHIGHGAPNKVDSASCHGAPLGADEIRAAREALGWTAPAFSIPQDILEAWDARQAGAQAEEAWKTHFATYTQQYPELAKEFQRCMSGALPDTWNATVAEALKHCLESGENVATRIASQKALQAFGSVLPELMGGSADLTGSVGTFTAHSKAIARDDYGGNYIYYGVREFAMGAIMNGMALHGGILPYAGTFMMFSDYARNAIRLSALMGVRLVWVLTHDSIGVGEDGPTHQPVEHVPSLRLIPGLHVWRPCDTLETLIAWKCAVEDTKHPHCMSLSRQNVPFVQRTPEQVALVERGGYVLQDCEGLPDVILLATGSEVALALEAASMLSEQGRLVRVVSMPCTEVFDAQDDAYREFVLPHSVRARVAIEAASADYWYKYVGLDGAVVGMKCFGASATGKVLSEHFGFTAEHIVETVKKILA